MRCSSGIGSGRGRYSWDNGNTAGGGEARLGRGMVNDREDGACVDITLGGNGQVTDGRGSIRGGRTCCMSGVGQQAPLRIPFLGDRSSVLDGPGRDFIGDSVRSMSESAPLILFGIPCGKSSSRSINSVVKGLDFFGRKKGCAALISLLTRGGESSTTVGVFKTMSNPHT